MMRIKGRWFNIVLILCLLCSTAAKAQDSCGTRVSLLTCSPGSELYSIFGHSALRVVDAATGTDIVYNYGTFDFDDPDFYSKFIRGKLLYSLSQTSFPNFAYEYQADNRSIAEQILNLTCAQKDEIRKLLFVNMQEENRYYKYDFLYQNCTTRLRDIIEQFRNPALREGPVETAEGMSFREGIHYYLNRGGMHWSKFGIDLLLGSRIDKKMTNREAMFLPEFLEQSLDKTGKQNDSLVAGKQYPVVKQRNHEDGKSLFTPLVVFSIIALLVAGMGMSENKKVANFLKTFDVAYFFVLGLLGCLFLFMWVGTDHKQTADNYNLLWAWPTHIIAAFLLKNKKANVRRYFFIYLIVAGVTLLAWPFLPQALNPAIIPVLLTGIFRSWKMYREDGLHPKKNA
jgi:hypothetical protein